MATNELNLECQPAFVENKDNVGGCFWGDFGGIFNIYSKVKIYNDALQNSLRGVYSPGRISSTVCGLLYIYFTFPKI